MLNLSYNPRFDIPDDLDLVSGMCKVLLIASTSRPNTESVQPRNQSV